MALIVQKFGGTSVADSEKILAAARRAVRAQIEGNQVVMVVSAMGKNTDHLIHLANEINETPPEREMDMLLSTGEQVTISLMAMAIDALGHKAISFTGAQVGIKTDSIHTSARIKSISTERMQKALDNGSIVIVAGFQGIDEDFNITTLGRGGSDTTAVALAAVLNAAACEIYTDVDGVYTTDPRILPAARKVDQIAYDEMLELASLGAGVMHNRSIEFAKKFNVPIHVRSSFSFDDSPGTMIVAAPESPDQPVSGCALVKNEARVTISNVPDQPGTSYTVFNAIAQKNVTVDMIVQNVGSDGKADISFTVENSELNKTIDALNSAIEELGSGEVSYDDSVGKVSVVGLGMAEQTGVAETMFRKLADADINLSMITTSEIKISALVSRDQAAESLRVAHQAFDLHQAPVNKNAPFELKEATQNDAIDIIARLQGMEDLTVEDVSLDSSQGRVTITNLPDTPGFAAEVFEAVAEAGIFVDMIVQDAGIKGKANLTFTTPKEQVDQAVTVAEQLAEKLNCGPVTKTAHISKISILGIGMRSHTDVAIRAFEALKNADINVRLINTSEVRVNIVVSAEAGEKALNSLKAAFEDAIG